MCVEYSILFPDGIPQLSDIIQMIENISDLNGFKYSDSLPYSISHNCFKSSIDLRTSENEHELLIDAFDFPQKYLEAVTIHACIKLGGIYPEERALTDWGNRKWNEVPDEVKAKLM